MDDLGDHSIERYNYIPKGANLQGIPVIRNYNDLARIRANEQTSLNRVGVSSMQEYVKKYYTHDKEELLAVLEAFSGSTPLTFANKFTIGEDEHD
jgi:hypothetical protein